MGKSLKEMTLKERFDSRGFSPMAYSRAYKVDRTTLTRVLDGTLTGEKESPRSGGVRKIFAQLKKDKIWIGPLPWEKEK
ncbi:hypothetical protein [Arcobacter sp.]|uniref:hypothetical protein n=1 Tax=unclassified Arcobacter TaxID=2593671 RepID=UPI003B0000E4